MSSTDILNYTIAHAINRIIGLALIFNRDFNHMLQSIQQIDQWKAPFHDTELNAQLHYACDVKWMADTSNKHLCCQGGPVVCNFDIYLAINVNAWRTLTDRLLLRLVRMYTVFPYSCVTESHSLAVHRYVFVENLKTM